MRVRRRAAALFAGLLATLLCVPVFAQESGPDSGSDPLRALSGSTAPVARVVKPARIGYAFSDPPVLLRQRLIGLAHGLRLLGRTCLLDPEFSLSAEQAYATWFARQEAAIETMSLDLERWYFGDVVPEPDPAARLREVIRLLGLRTELRPMAADEQRAACASYPQAIAGPRYDFAALLDEAERELAGQAVAPSAQVDAASATLSEPSVDATDAVAPDTVVSEPINAPYTTLPTISVEVAHEPDH